LGSAIVGLLIGLKFRVVVIAVVAPIIAVAAAITLRDFNLVPAVAITIASLLVNQIAYLVGAWLRSRSI
jgi:Na+(H+)/acetate symporter ActP